MTVQRTNRVDCAFTRFRIKKWTDVHISMWYQFNLCAFPICHGAKAIRLHSVFNNLSHFILGEDRSKETVLIQESAANIACKTDLARYNLFNLNQLTHLCSLSGRDKLSIAGVEKSRSVHSSGATATPLTTIPQWRCGPVDCPVDPINPMRCPFSTRSPTLT